MNRIKKEFFKTEDQDVYKLNKSMNEFFDDILIAYPELTGGVPIMKQALEQFMKNMTMMIVTYDFKKDHRYEFKVFSNGSNGEFTINVAIKEA